MKNFTNKEFFEGRLHSFDLEKKKVQNVNSPNFGKEFWSGTINIATDEEGLNIVPVHYTFVTPTFAKSGKTDSRYAALEKIKNENKTWLEVGKDNAEMIRLTPSGDLNDFYIVEGDKGRFVSAQRNEGGFITFINSLAPEGLGRNKFTFDVVFNKITIVSPEEEFDPPVHAKLHGGIFNFNGALLPFDMVAYNPRAIQYFEEMIGDECFYTQVWGSVRNTTIKQEKTTENAFGEPTVEYVERTRREWVIEGARTQPYEFTEEDAVQLNEKTAARNLNLERIKTDAIKYAAEKKNAPAAPANPTTMAGPLSGIPNGAFNDF